jgi:hypothetical protein
MGPPCNVPLSSQSSVRGKLVTIRWSGLNPLAFHPEARIYHNLAQVPDNMNCRLSRCAGVGIPGDGDQRFLTIVIAIPG